jgi:hypothetical protein
VLASPSPKCRVPHQEGAFTAARQTTAAHLVRRNRGLSQVPSCVPTAPSKAGPRDRGTRGLGLLAHTDSRVLKHRSLGNLPDIRNISRPPKDRHRLSLEHNSNVFPTPRAIATPVHRRQRSPASWLKPTHAQPALATGVVNHGCTSAQRRGSLVPLGDHVLVFARLRNCARGARPQMSDDADLAVLAPSLLASWKLRFRTSRRLGSSAFLFCFNITKPRPDDEGESLSRSRLASTKRRTGLEPVPAGKSREVCVRVAIAQCNAPGCLCTL